MKKIARILLTLMFLVVAFATTAMAFDVTINSPSEDDLVGNSILLNVMTSLGGNTNCTYNISDSATDLIASSNNNLTHIWTDIDISTLVDGSITINLQCVNSANVSDGNVSLRTIEKDTTAPVVTWINPVNSGTPSGDTIVLLTANVTSESFTIDQSNTAVFTISCAGGDDGTLFGNSLYTMVNVYNGTITQNWTTPFDAANCNISVNVSNSEGFYNDTEIINVDVQQTPFINNEFVDLDDEDYVLIGTGGPGGAVGSYPLVGFFVEANASNEYGVNLTHNNLCIGLDDTTHFFPYNMSIYNVSEDLWEFEFNCTVNKSLLVDGENILELELVLNNSALSQNVNFTIYNDATVPEIHFEWWDTKAWNSSSNTTYDLRLPDYLNLILNNDIFFAPNDEIFVSVNVTDSATFYSNISEVYANFTGLGTDAASTCVGLVALTYNDTFGMWEGNCSLGDFSQELVDPVETGNVTFVVYDSYDNTNFYGDYNMTTSPAEVCMVGTPDCMPLHVPINLHNFGQLEAEDDCYQFNGLTTNLNNVPDWNNFDFIIDMYINLSCEMNDSSFSGDFTPMVFFNFSGVDFSTPAMGQKLAMLEDAIDFLFVGASDFGDSWIYINSTAFEELNVSSTIIFRHLPFTSFPDLIAEDPAHLNSTSVEWVTNGLDALFDNQVITGNLTFKVFGFSGYDISDSVIPTINITAPNSYDIPDTLITVETYLNGTGTDISYTDFRITGNATPIGIFNSTLNSANCTESSNGSDYYYCTFDYNITTGDGLYNLSVYAQDYGGDAGNNATSSVEFYLDTVEPNATMYNEPNLVNNGWVNENTFNFTFIAEDDYSTLLDYDFWVVNSTGQDVQATIVDNTTSGNLEGVLTTLTAGIDNDTLTWYLYVMDNAGNAVTYSNNFSLDRVDPVTTDDNSGVWENSIFNITLSPTDAGSGIDYANYTIDGGAQITYTTPIEITVSGNYTIVYYSVDVAGNVESTTTTNALLDLEDPTTSDNVPVGWQTSTFFVTLTETDATSQVDFTNYSINGSAEADYVIPFQISTEGEYNVSYYSVDNAGNVQTTVNKLVQLDTVDPVTTDDNSGVWENSIFNVTLSATDATSGVDYINYTIDGGAQITYTAPIEITVSGNYTVVYYSVDNAGNIESTTTTNALLDLENPTTSDDLVLGWHTGDFTITLTEIDATSGVDYTNYSINGTWYQGASVAISIEGEYNVSYYSVDNAGNIQSTVTRLVQLDKVDPVSIDDYDDTWRGSAYNITLSASDSNSGVDYINYSIDGGAVITYTTPIEITTEWNHTIVYYSADVAGNVESVNTLYALLDLTAPVTTDNAPSGWQTSDFTVTLTPTDVNGSGIAYTNYSINGAAEQTGTSVLIDTEGEYNITYYSVDNVGHVESNNLFSIQLDKTAPGIVDNSSNYTGYQYEVFNVTVIVTDDDNLSGYDYCNYSIDGAINVTKNTTTFMIPITDEGKYNVSYYCYDVAGNVNSSTFEVEIDATAPVTTDDAPSGWQDANFTVTLNATDGYSGVNETYYSIDGAAYITYTTPFEISTDGEYNVTYYSTDNVTNVEDVNTFLVQLDKVAPNLTITSPVNGTTYTSSSVDLTYTTTDATSGENVSMCLYNLDSMGYTDCVATMTSLADGNHTVSVNVYDYASNSAVETIDIFTIEEPPVRVSSNVDLPLLYNASGVYMFNLTITDNSALHMVLLYLNGTKIVMNDIGLDLFSYNATGLSIGVRDYYFWANDTNGFAWNGTVNDFEVKGNLSSDEVFINDTNYIVPENATNLIVDELVNVTVPENITESVYIDLGNEVSDNEYTFLDNVTLERKTATINYTVEIPSGTTLTADVSWDEKLMMPEVEVGVETPSGTSGTVDVAVQFGSDVEISFDNAVRIVLQGQAGKQAGWKRTGTELTAITTVCDDEFNPTNINAVGPQMCYINDSTNTDLIIWTYHFTTFATGSWETDSSSGGSSSRTTYQFGVMNQGEAQGQTLKQGDRIKFQTKEGGEDHTLTLDDVNPTNRKVTLTIESDPVTLEMNESIVYKVDTDENGMYDTEVWFEYSSSTRAVIYLQTIAEVAEEVPIVTPVVETEEEPPVVPQENVDTAPVVVDDNIDDNTIVVDDNNQVDEVVPVTTTDDLTSGSNTAVWITGIALLIILGVLLFVIVTKKKSIK